MGRPRPWRALRTHRHPHRPGRGSHDDFAEVLWSLRWRSRLSRSWWSHARAPIGRASPSPRARSRSSRQAHSWLHYRPAPSASLPRRPRSLHPRWHRPSHTGGLPRLLDHHEPRDPRRPRGASTRHHLPTSPILHHRQRQQRPKRSHPMKWSCDRPRCPSSRCPRCRRRRHLARPRLPSPRRRHRRPRRCRRSQIAPASRSSVSRSRARSPSRPSAAR